MPVRPKNPDKDGVFDCDQYYDELPHHDDFEKLNIQGKGIKKIINLNRFEDLRELNCSDNELTELPDLNKHELLNILNCSHNELTELPDLSKFENLRELNCSYNPLTKLPDLNKNRFKYLNCSNTKIKHVKVYGVNDNGLLNYEDNHYALIDCTKCEELIDIKIDGAIISVLISKYEYNNINDKPPIKIERINDANVFVHTVNDDNEDKMKKYYKDFIKNHKNGHPWIGEKLNDKFPINFYKQRYMENFINHKNYSKSAKQAIKNVSEISGSVPVNILDSFLYKRGGSRKCASKRIAKRKPKTKTKTKRRLIKK